jgi:hypothetical protein
MFFQDSEIEEFELNDALMNDYITAYPDEIELMQSTGLFDRNGKEIFEGDIVDYKGRKAVIKWHGSYASFIYIFVDELHKRVAGWSPLYLAYFHFEVIGNKFETPEFLEGKE